ncbi:unnamed protein product, partial [Musa hybrid cultivar]
MSLFFPPNSSYVISPPKAPRKRQIRSKCEKKATATEVGRRRIPLAVGTFSVKRQPMKAPKPDLNRRSPRPPSLLRPSRRGIGYVVFLQRWEPKGELL